MTARNIAALTPRRFVPARRLLWAAKNETGVSFFSEIGPRVRVRGAGSILKFRAGVRSRRKETTMKPNNDNSFFAEPADLQAEARDLAVEAIRRLLIWMSDAPTLEDRGLRSTVALYCVRPDLIRGATLEQIGDAAGLTRQAVYKLADSFRLVTGLAP